MSSDGTVEYVNGINFPKNISFTFLSNNDTGISNAWNQAINLSTGDMILFLNAGDEYFEDFILTCDLCDKSYVHCFSTFIKSNSKLKLYKADHTKLNKGMFVPHNWVLFPKDVLFEFGYDEGLQLAMDYKLLLQIYINYPNTIVSYSTPFGYYSLDGVSDRNYLRSFYTNYKIKREIGSNKFFIDFPYFLFSIVKHSLYRLFR